MHTTSKLSLVALLIASLSVSGCFQAEVTTDRTAGDTTVEKKWAPSFLMGLVPATIDVSDDCPNGVASAKRKLSFPNLLVSQLTLGIYAPQTVTVTCAAGGSMSAVGPAPASRFALPSDATEADIEDTLSEAVLHSARTQDAVEVRVARN